MCLKSDSDAPLPRAGHSAAIHDGNLYVFGGKGDENVKYNDFWRFEIEKKRWFQITVDDESTVPLPRSGHSAIVYKDYMILFGGIYEITRELNDLHIYDLKNKSWNILFREKEPPTPMLTQSPSPVKSANATGVSPYGRKATLLGTTQNNSTLKDTSPAKKNNFDTTQKKKKIVITEAKVEEEVKLESPTSVEMKNSLLIKHADPSFDSYASLKKRKTAYGYGGANIFGLATTTGLKGKSRCPGNRPAPRDGHSGILYDNYFMVFGGDRHHMPFNDLFALDIASEFSKRGEL